LVRQKNVLEGIQALTQTREEEECRCADSALNRCSVQSLNAISIFIRKVTPLQSFSASNL
ncbi:hypothetical protein U1Q18_038915, partial [Sarracenia purpurea var. burkii]